jgi:hypothetical protein
MNIDFVSQKNLTVLKAVSKQEFEQKRLEHGIGDAIEKARVPP